MKTEEKCPGSGMPSTHSDASYRWMCPVCARYLSVSSARDDTPIVRPHLTASARKAKRKPNP